MAFLESVMYVALNPSIADILLYPQAFLGIIDAVVAKFPNVKVVATTLREVCAPSRKYMHVYPVLPLDPCSCTLAAP